MGDVELVPRQRPWYAVGFLVLLTACIVLGVVSVWLIDKGGLWAVLGVPLATLAVCCGAAGLLYVGGVIAPRALTRWLARE
jgi:hypothetical protein